MRETPSADWKKKIVSPEKVFAGIKPGMSIFLGTGVAEPRRLVRHLLDSDSRNLQDLELVQLVSFGDAISIKELSSHKFRLKTVFAGWVAFDAITEGRVDLIPCLFSRVPRLVESGAIRVDAAFIQITRPDDSGHCSLGVAVDVARQVMERASLVVGEINPNVPCTMGDTFVNVDDFDLLVESDEPLIEFPRWPVDEVFDRVAANVASIIDDGSCLAFSIGPLFEALAPHLARKRNLGVHTPMFTDALMDLVKCGAVTNRYKGVFRGKSLTSFALGTKELMRWLHWNPLIEFQGIDKVVDPQTVGRNDNFVALLSARKVNLTGRIVLHFGKGNVAAGPGEALDLVTGALLSRGGRTIVALPSRNRKGEPNILLNIDEYPNQFTNRESVDHVVTEYGAAYLYGRTIRERAQALIDVAHPDDRKSLIEQAKASHILYPDQIYLAESGRLYPKEIETEETFKDGLKVKFRAILPSDEEGMRRLFYRFSDQAVYYRYFSPIRSMPHSKMQEYVNVDYKRMLSIVGLVDENGQATLIAEARYVINPETRFADVAFVVDENHQKRGVATYMFLRLIQIAVQNGVKGFTGDVLATNKPMMRVFEKSPYPVQAALEAGVYQLNIPFIKLAPNRERGITYVR